MKVAVPVLTYFYILLAAFLHSGCTLSSHELVFKQDQKLYVIDKESSAVSVYSKQGKLSQFIGVPSAGPEQKKTPIPSEIVRFLLSGKGSISGLIWEDLNNNKSYDEGEPGVEGVRVFIDQDHDGLYTSYETAVLSNVNGFYTFPRVRQGTTNIYIDKVTLPNGYEIITNHPFSLTLSRSEIITNASIGVQNRSGFINGTVWDQTDNAPIPGVVIYLDQDNDSELSVGEPYDTTNVSGNYLIPNLPGGLYKFNIDDKSLDEKYYQPPGSGTSPTDVTLVPGGSQTIDLSFVHKAKISGVVLQGDGNPWGYIRVFIDLNGNGIYDAGEPVTVTDKFGNYSFNELPPGSYMIIIQFPSGHTMVVSPGTIDLQAGENNTGAHFLTQAQPAAISSFAWNDKNGNSTPDVSENGFEGLTIFLDTNNNGLLDAGEQSSVTDSNGAYSFTGLNHGNYYIRADDSSILNAFTFTGAANPVEVSLSPGQLYEGARFGYQSKLSLQHTLKYPARLTWGGDGNLYVSDNTNGSVFIYDSTLNPQGELKGLAKPLAVAVDGAGNIYVANQGRNNIEVYDSSGNLVRSFADGIFGTPNDMVFDKDNNIYILDSENDIVHVYDQAGNPTGSTLGSSSIFDYAISIAINYRDDATGTLIGELYAADQPNCTIHIFSLDGTHKGSAGSCGSLYTSNWDGKFAGLVAVGVDQYDNIHGLDNSLNVVQVFEPQTGAFLKSYNAYLADNEFFLNLQTDISVHPTDNRVIVSNVATQSVETITTVPAP